MAKIIITLTLPSPVKGEGITVGYFVNSLSPSAVAEGYGRQAVGEGWGEGVELNVSYPPIFILSFPYKRESILFLGR